MATIWKRKNSKYLTACYTNKDGVQVKRSTKVTERNRAIEIAIEWEEAEKHARNGTLTKVQLHKVLNELSEKATGDGINVPTVEKFLNDWLKSKELNGASAGTIERYTNTVKLFLSFLGDDAKRLLTGVTPFHIQNFADTRRKNGAAPKTVIVDVKTLRGAFNRAENLMLILKNPTKAVELPKNVSSERNIFTHEQVLKVLESLNSGKSLSSVKMEWRTLILLGYYTGARLSDCIKLRWSDVDLKRGCIVYRQQKTGKIVVIPIHAQLHHYLWTHYDFITEFEEQPIYVCGSLSEKSSGGKHGLSETFLRILERAGIEQTTVQGQGKRKFNSLTFHSLRHSFNSIMYSAGVPQEDRMRLTGHSSIAMNDRYTHPVDFSRLSKAINYLPEFRPNEELEY